MRLGYLGDESHFGEYSFRFRDRPLYDVALETGGQAECSQGFPGGRWGSVLATHPHLRAGRSRWNGYCTHFLAPCCISGAMSYRRPWQGRGWNDPATTHALRLPVLFLGCQVVTVTARPLLVRAPVIREWHMAPLSWSHAHNGLSCYCRQCRSRRPNPWRYQGPISPPLASGRIGALASRWIRR